MVGARLNWILGLEILRKEKKANFLSFWFSQNKRVRKRAYLSRPNRF